MLALVVDDDEKIVKVLAAYLEKEGCQVVKAFDGLAAVDKVRDIKPDIILLDVMLPGKDGLAVCREVRRFSDVPVIMLTARDAETDRIVGLEIGADDYVVKPFSPREVMARVRAVLRRTARPRQELGDNMLSHGDIRLDMISHAVTVGDRQLELTPTEFKLLELFLKHPNQVLSRLQLIEKIQGCSFEGYERTVDTHIKNLRKKLGGSPGESRWIKTVYGVGYKLAGDRQ